MAHNPTHPYVSSAREAGNRQQQQKDALQRNLALRKAQIEVQKAKASSQPADVAKPADAS